MPPKHQAFVFTHNNYADEDTKMYEKLLKDGYIRFIAYGKEVAPTTGTVHLQGFVWLDKLYPLQNVKRKLNGAWVGVPGKEKGVPYHVVDDGKTGFGYCFKEHCPGWVLAGIPPTEDEFEAQCPKGQGSRSDILEVKHKIDAGVDIMEIMDQDEHFGVMVRHSKFFEVYQSTKRRRTGWSPPIVNVLYGGTGSNKSRRVWEKYNYDTSKLWKLAPAMVSGQTVWYDGYAGHEAVLLEEFRPGHMKFGEFLDLTDGYPSKVQIKGTTVHWSPKEIWITSPVHPVEWYPNLTANDKIDQLLRRIHKITECFKVPVPASS